MDMSIQKRLFKREVYEIAAQIVLNGHCKHALATDAQGRIVHPEHEAAVSFCTLTAIAKAKAQVENSRFNVFAEVGMGNTYRRHFERFMGLPDKEICVWNNQPERTPEEIAGKLREFAATF